MFNPAGDWELDEAWDDRDTWEDPDRDFYNGQLWGHSDGEFLGDYDPRFWPAPADDRVLEAPLPDDLQRLRQKFPGCWKTWGPRGLFDMGPWEHVVQELPIEESPPTYRLDVTSEAHELWAEFFHPTRVRAK